MFTWSPYDMTHVSSHIITRKLNVFPHAKPIKQKKQRFVLDQTLIVKSKMEELLKVGILFEV